jgi:hypothetical protein
MEMGKKMRFTVRFFGKDIKRNRINFSGLRFYPDGVGGQLFALFFEFKKNFIEQKAILVPGFICEKVEARENISRKSILNRINIRVICFQAGRNRLHSAMVIGGKYRL